MKLSEIINNSKHDSSSFHLIFLIIFPLFLFKILKICLNNNNQNHHIPPSPAKLPIIGNLLQLGSVPRRSLKLLADKYGPVMLLQLGSKPTFVVSSAEAAEEILKKKDLIFTDRPGPSFAGRLLYGYKDVVFTPYGEYWRQTRGICVSQLLSAKMVRSFRNVREDEIARMMESLRESISSTVCISDNLSTLSNNIVSRVSLGKRYSEEKEGVEFKALFMATNIISGYANIGDFIPWLGWINYINGMEAKVTRVQKEVDVFLESNIEEAIKRQAEEEYDDDQKEQNFVDALVRFQCEEQDSGGIGSNLDRDSMKAIIMIMVLGGTNAIASLLEWTLSELLRNPDIMSKLQTEVRKDVGTMMINEEKLHDLPYLKAVIRESLRLYPPAGLIPRESRDDAQILGFDVPAKTQVLINVWAIARDPQLWEEPEKFRPERFLAKNPSDYKGQHFQFLPFGSGRRMCPGFDFALVIVELALANLIREFNFELPDGARPEDLDMNEAHGIVNPRKIPLLLVPTLPN